MYILQMFDWYAASISVISICLVEAIVVGWTYGKIGKVTFNFVKLNLILHYIEIVIILFKVVTILSEMLNSWLGKNYTGGGHFAGNTLRQ